MSLGRVVASSCFIVFCWRVWCVLLSFVGASNVFYCLLLVRLMCFIVFCWCV